MSGIFNTSGDILKRESRAENIFAVFFQDPTGLFSAVSNTQDCIIVFNHREIVNNELFYVNTITRV